jgi:carbon storage regulator
MLVLSRKQNETIVIPQLGIEITLVAIRGDKARIGINAPREYDVHRGEVQRAIEDTRTVKDAAPSATCQPELAGTAGKAD